MAGKINIGTSGWVYKHWRGLYYPQKLAARLWLPFYSQDFNTTEINSSFYKLPTIESVQNWVKQVPKGFVFCPKMSRYLTHMKKLKDPEEPLERFFSAFIHMKDSIGPILIQLPPQLKFSYDTAEHFYSLLKNLYSDYRFAVEVRHNTWLAEESLTLMTKYDIAFVISHSNDIFPYAEMVTADSIYIRFHGPEELYASPYQDETLIRYAEKIMHWKVKGHDIWVYFNNDIHGHAVRDAKRLLELCSNMTSE